MNSADEKPEVSKARPGLLSPWRWMMAGLATCVTAFAWARLCNGDQVPLAVVQVSMAVLGVGFAGVAVWVRCGWPQPPSLNDLPSNLRKRAVYALAAMQALLALGVSAWVLLKLARPELPGDVGGTILLWLLTAPWCAYSAFQLTQLGSTATPLEARLETAVLVTQAGVVALLASWALYWGSDFRWEWDSLRLFFAVLTAAALLSAPLIAARSPIRRIAVSTLVVLHFAAILTVVIGASPGPWILGQAQQWIFRPYLEFMYLNNAYRFYSPEPGPASQLWFRIEYEQDGKPLPAKWLKLPNMDDNGNHRYPTSLQYTRRLALTENVARVDPMPPLMVPNSKGEIVLAPFAMNRDAQSPSPMYKDKLGYKPPKNSLEIPLHPDPSVPNYQQPTGDGKVLLASYARHILRQPPTVPGAKAVAVKIYRVQHRILLAETIAMGADPRDWIFFLPYYMGKYDPSGNLMMDEQENAFLYWLLPIVRVNADDPKSDLKCYFLKQAGDREWQRQPPRW